MKSDNKNNMQRGSTGFAVASLAIAVAAFSASGARAGESIYFDNGASLDWSVTTTYGLGMRMSDPDSDLLEGQANADDGNRNFDRHSLMTHRVTALGEIILRKDNYGAVLRGSTFYDDVYHRSNDNDSPGTVNKDGDHNEFTSDAKKYSGGRSRFLDAYVFADFELPARQRLGVKAGRHVVAWGEGLFYPGVNGVQGPVNVVNSGQPGIEVKDIMLPVGQVSANWEVNPDFGLSAYVQYEWKGNELNPVGSYLSTSDVTGPGREFMILIPGLANANYAGTNDPRDSGQYGIRAMYRPTLATELGFFHVRYHDRNPSGVSQHNFVEVMPGVMLPSSYEIDYAEDIKLTGMSFSTSVGDTQVGGEWSYRTGVPVMLANNAGTTTGSGQQMQLSFIRAFGDMPWASSTTIMGEVVHVRADDVDRIGNNDDYTFKTASSWQTRTSTAYTLQAVLSYPGIFSGWDLNVPINWAHVVDGNTPLKGTISAGEGDKRMSVGATFKYLGNLELNTTYTAYLYSADPSRNRMLADRDYLTISAKYSF